MNRQRIKKAAKFMTKYYIHKYAAALIVEMGEWGYVLNKKEIKQAIKQAKESDVYCGLIYSKIGGWDELTCSGLATYALTWHHEHEKIINSNANYTHYAKIDDEITEANRLAEERHK